MYKFAPLLYSYILAPTCFGSSLPSSGSFWIGLSYVKMQIDMVVYHFMWLSGLCAGVTWFSLLLFLWLFMLRLIMHGTNIKKVHPVLHNDQIHIVMLDCIPLYQQQLIFHR
jgi:hypothetical protein